MKRRTLALLAVVTVAIVVVAVVLFRPDGSDDPLETAQPAGLEDVPSDLARFYEQTLEWEECDDDVECTWVTVPIDYEDPAGATTRLRVAVHAATGDGQRALLVNPGGPGGSAIDYAAQLASTFGDEVRDEFAVVGVDPRGVGLSEPVDCLDDDALDAYTAGDIDPTTPAEVREFQEQLAAFGEGCADLTGELAGHVSTEEAARDMDVVRALLGQERLDWFGASYGTALGSTYATLFPERVGAMVLDGAVDPSESVVEGAMSQAVGFQRALVAYLESCVAQESCPLGGDVDRALERLATFLEILEDQPIDTNDPDRPLTAGRAFYGLALPLYDKAGWPLLTQAMTQALRGDGTTMLLLADAYAQRSDDGTFANNQSEAITAVNCLDAAERPGADEVERILPEFEEASPVFGRPLAWGTAACADWPFPADHPQVDIDAEGASPIVVVGTTRDPATPYESAERMTELLGDGVGVLLTREGDGHTAYASGNQCIVNAVDAYLVDGTVPAEGTRCADE